MPLVSDCSSLSPKSPLHICHLYRLFAYSNWHTGELDRFATKSRNLSWIRSVIATPLSPICELLKGKKENQSVQERHC
ncbi:Gamma-tubulin complex component like [Actinidia chinensis var. chinensis]|uniref:Gamma-tubulin complex component like n=1 Tax=Actinidia chinensis var. chinensis TaxID=1590841 RepID=A0A2R6QHL9_ACTCC|nr:Gamma-tubulin complex component like [Actinidia chinensis var. chinensis]